METFVKIYHKQKFWIQYVSIDEEWELSVEEKKHQTRFLEE